MLIEENGARAGTRRSTQACCTANRKILGRISAGRWPTLWVPAGIIGTESDVVWASITGKAGSMGGVGAAGSARADRCRCTLAMASGLFSAAFLALDGGSISLTGMPGPPVLCGFLTSRAAITSLGPSGQEPAFAIFKQASATARVPTAKAAWLTRRQRAGTLKWAHGRASSRAVRRREGSTSRRYFAPTAWTPLVQAPAADTCQLTCSISHVRGDGGARSERRPMPRSTDRGMAQLALR